MSKMAKKVGKAVIKALGNRRGFDDLFDAIHKRDMVEIFDEVGRAAIEAMREPTEAMITAARITDLWDMSVPDAAPSTEHIEGTRDELGNAWRAMIDEALK